MKAEALKWENRRLSEAKAQLEVVNRDQQRRVAQLEEALHDLKATPGCHHRRYPQNSSPSNPSNPAALKKPRQVELLQRGSCAHTL